MPHKRLTTEQVIEIYNGTALEFEYYHKYKFTFSGVAKDNAVITCTCCEDSESIYRAEFCKNYIVFYECDFEDICIEKNGNLIYKRSGVTL